MKARRWELDVYETDNYDESPLPGETLIFKDNGQKYTPPEEPKKTEKEKEEEEEGLSLEALDDLLMERLS